MRSSEPRPEWRLVLDGTICDGHGICVLRCPELLSLDEHGFAGAEASPFSSRSLLRRARRAAAACPARALTVLPARLGDTPGGPLREGRKRSAGGTIELVELHASRRPGALQ
jgi:ferredoxin